MYRLKYFSNTGDPDVMFRWVTPKRPNTGANRFVNGPPGPETRTPAVAGTKAGAKDCGNWETSRNFDSTFHRFDAMRHKANASLHVEVFP